MLVEEKVKSKFKQADESSFGRNREPIPEERAKMPKTQSEPNEILEDSFKYFRDELLKFGHKSRNYQEIRSLDYPDFFKENNIRHDLQPDLVTSIYGWCEGHIDNEIPVLDQNYYKIVEKHFANYDFITNMQKRMQEDVDCEEEEEDCEGYLHY